MNVTGFCPMILTKDPESVMKVFEALGFERRHTKTDIHDGRNINYVMKDANGNRVNIAKTEKFPKDAVSLSINVDDFQAAYDLLLDQGFIDPRGGQTTETSSSKDTFLLAPSGFPVTLTQHIRKDEQ